MTLTVGTDSYITTAYADTYWGNRGDTTWAAATTAQKEAAILEATQYIDGAYSFIGAQKDGNALCWPRYDVLIPRGNMAGLSYDSETIPPHIQTACAEFALIALGQRLDPYQARGGAVKREKVDVIEVEYTDGAPAKTTYPFIDKILGPLLICGGGTRPLVRV